MPAPKPTQTAARRFQRRLQHAVFLQNPLLAQALSITPVAAVAYNVKTAIALGAVIAALLIPLELLTSLLLKRLPTWLRGALYMAFGTGMAAWLTPLITETYKGVGITLGVFLPLMAVNSLLYQRCEDYALTHSIKNSLIDAVTFTTGAVVVIILVGVLREFFGYGTLYGISVGVPGLIPAMAYPFAGLILLGFLAALFNAYKNKIYELPPDTPAQREEEPHD